MTFDWASGGTSDAKVTTERLRPFHSLPFLEVHQRSAKWAAHLKAGVSPEGRHPAFEAQLTSFRGRARVWQPSQYENDIDYIPAMKTAFRRSLQVGIWVYPMYIYIYPLYIFKAMLSHAAYRTGHF